MEEKTRMRYTQWLTAAGLDEETRRELEAIKEDPRAIEDRFYTELAFGTAGLRGLLGAGTNRMNRYVVRKATRGLGACVAAAGKEAVARGVVIAYDNRHRSREFCLEAAGVLAAMGIKVYIFDSLRTTPQLSYTLRRLGCTAGIVVTASHNPPDYNGYKVYWEDGAQIAEAKAEAIYQYISQVEDPFTIPCMDVGEAQEAGLVEILGPEADEAYLNQVKAQSIQPEVITQAGDALRIVYTPLHGTGSVPVQRVLREMGFRQLWVVPEQEAPDPDFATVTRPNPEEPQAFGLALELAQREEAALVLATDPDGDRLGAAVREPQGTYRLLTGNQIGVLLAHYLLTARKAKGSLPENGLLIKTVVTGELGGIIAADYGVAVENTLTGFKYIGERIKAYEASGEKTFLFGYEESNGYLSGPYARDKDAVAAALLLSEAAAWYHLQGKTLLDGLEALYARYGHYGEATISVTLEGMEGLSKIQRVLDYYRQHCPVCLEDQKVLFLEDYTKGERIPIGRAGKREALGLPTTPMLKFLLEGEGWLALRPSGTEAKFKIYVGVKTASARESEILMKKLTDCIVFKIRSM